MGLALLLVGAGTTHTLSTANHPLPSRMSSRRAQRRVNFCKFSYLLSNADLFVSKIFLPVFSVASMAFFGYYS